MKTNEIKSRASKGGEIGANGEFYKGGQFIAKTDAPKKRSVKRTGTGKQQVEPYKWEVAPEGKKSLFAMLAGMEIFNRAEMNFSFNSELRLDFALPEVVEKRMARIAAFNSGERWI